MRLPEAGGGGQSASVDAEQLATQPACFRGAAGGGAVVGLVGSAADGVDAA
jgi:hypothetical protein